MEVLTGESENEIPDPHAAMDKVVTYLLHDIVGPAAGAHLALVLNGPLFTHVRVCGATLSALLHGEELDDERVLEVYAQGIPMAALAADVRRFADVDLAAFRPSVTEMHVKVRGFRSHIRFVSVVSISDPFVAGPSYMATGLVKLPLGWFMEAVDLVAFAGKTIVVRPGVHPILEAVHAEAGYTVLAFNADQGE